MSGFTVSASQIEDWYTCPRKWGLRRLAKFQQNIGAFRGDSAHKLLEAWGRDRTPPERGEAAIVRELVASYTGDLEEKKISAEEYAARIVAVVNKMIPLLPDPPWERVEQRLRVAVDGVLWVGKIDLEYDNCIRDHKITSSADYALTEETIRNNCQALIYAYSLLVRKPSDEVVIGWTYGMPGKNPRAWKVETVFTPEHVHAALHPHNETAKKLVKLRVLNPNPLTFEPDFTACEKYGGCEFQQICQPTAEQLMAAYMSEIENTTSQGETKMGLLSGLKQKEAEGGAPASAATTAPPAQAAASAPKAEERSDTAHVIAECQKHAASLLKLGLSRADVVSTLQKRYVGIADIVDSLVSADAPKVEEKAAEKAPAATGAGTAINPPDSPPATAKVEAAPKAEKAAGGRKKLETTGEDPWFAARVKLIERIMSDQTIGTLEAANAISILRS